MEWYDLTNYFFLKVPNIVANPDFLNNYIAAKPNQ